MHFFPGESFKLEGSPNTFKILTYNEQCRMYVVQDMITGRISELSENSEYWMDKCQPYILTNYNRIWHNVVR